jgi:hypothetical protein
LREGRDKQMPGPKITRRGISSIIGGMIVLGVLLTALGSMIFVSQQFDAYQSVAAEMSQNDIARFSEGLVANYPGLSEPSRTIPCSGSGSGFCNQYNMSLSNVGGLTNAGSSNAGSSAAGGGGVGIQVVRVYINSTYDSSSGRSACVMSLDQQKSLSDCIFTPAGSPTAYRFQKSGAFINSGEFNHTLILWLPSGIGLLPNPTPPAPMNTIWIVTSRGRVFSFQWPFPPTGQALEAVNAVVATGTMRVAYTGIDDSKNEPTWNPQGPQTGQYCHTETANPSDAIAAGTYGTLYFVNPWVTDTILGDAAFGPTGGSSPTTMYIYAQFSNTKSTSVTISTGSLLIQVTAASANQKVYFIGGQYIGGILTGGTFVQAPSTLTVPANPNVVATLIFRIYNYNVGTQKNPTGAVTLSFSGMAAVSNTVTDSSYYGASLLLQGFYDRTSCTQP